MQKYREKKREKRQDEAVPLSKFNSFLPSFKRIMTFIVSKAGISL